MIQTASRLALIWSCSASDGKHSEKLGEASFILKFVIPTRRLWYRTLKDHWGCLCLETHLVLKRFLHVNPPPCPASTRWVNEFYHHSHTGNTSYRARLGWLICITSWEIAFTVIYTFLSFLVGSFNSRNRAGPWVWTSCDEHWRSGLEIWRGTVDYR